jgi:hypothetical protein
MCICIASESNKKTIAPSTPGRSPRDGTPPYSIKKHMDLNQYPQAIAQAATLVNDLEFQIHQAKRIITAVEGRVDAQIAFGDYKNDPQRRAVRFELLNTDSSYQEALHNLGQLIAAKAKAVVELELTRNQYSVAKIEARAAMVQQIAALDCAEFIGL